MPKTLYGNGIGVGFTLWFKAPRKYVKNNEYTTGRAKGVRVYTPRSTGSRLGFWILKKGINRNGDCVTILSENKQDVLDFMEAAQDYIKFFKKSIVAGHAMKQIGLFIDRIQKIRREG